MNTLTYVKLVAICYHFYSGGWMVASTGCQYFFDESGPKEVPYMVSACPGKLLTRKGVWGVVGECDVDITPGDKSRKVVSL